MKEEEKNKSRRQFLKFGLTAGAASLVGLGGAVIAGKSNPLPAVRQADDEKKPGRKVKVLTPEGKLVEVDESQIRPAEKVEIASIDKAREGLPDKKFVMIIDLAKCKNARKCVDACQEGHHLPRDHEWIKVQLLQDSEYTHPYWFPKPCFHCDQPLCVSVCPVGATFKRNDGIVLVDNERCIGCKFCMTGCPYSARVFHWKESEVEQPDVEYSAETNVPSEEGTVGKCVFCADKLRKGELPRCVTACPMGVIYFGDLIEDAVTNGTETIRFSQLIEERAGYRYLEELGTHPTVYYLPTVNRMFPVESGFEGLEEDIHNRYEKFIHPKLKKK